MREASPPSEKTAWALSRGQNLFLALFLLTLLGIHLINTLPGILAAGETTRLSQTHPDPFVVEIHGTNTEAGIYTFSEKVSIEEALLAAGVVRERIPHDARSKPVRTGTSILLEDSDSGLSIHLEPMDSAKKILYALPIDVNEVGTEDLQLIPGIGPSLAGRIADYRNRKGRLTRFEELLEVPGIGRKRLETLRSYLTVETASPSTP
jgi:competence protein ComEA